MRPSLHVRVMASLALLVLHGNARADDTDPPARPAGAAPASAKQADGSQPSERPPRDSVAHPCTEKSGSNTADCDAGKTKRGLLPKDFADGQYALSLAMEFDYVPDAEGELAVQSPVYRPALALEIMPEKFTGAPGSCQLQGALGVELSYSRADRFFGDGDAQLKLTHLWGSGYWIFRTVHRVIAVEWLRVRISVGPSRLSVDDRVSGEASKSWKPRGEVAGLMGLRLWSFFLVQAGVSYVFGGKDFQLEPKDGSGDAPTFARPKEGPAAIMRAALEYRF